MRRSQKSAARTATAATEIVRVGKDELNLIELPWTSLWKHEAANAVLFHEWEMSVSGGKNIKCSWRVAGDPVLGLPNASALRLFLVLIEITREKGVSDVVHFTPYDLLKRLGWPTTAQYYKLLVTSFTRLKAVQIHAQNCWRDPKTGAYAKDALFSIVNDVVIYNHSRQNAARTKQEGGELPLSFFEWNSRVLESVKAGQLATYDLDFALSLKNDVALSLFRLLSKKTHRQRAFEMDLEEFYHRHLGMRPTRFASKMKERLKAGHEELLERGFLESVTYEPSKRTGREKVRYVVRGFVDAISDGSGDGNAPGGELRVRLLTLGLSEEVADGLLGEYSHEDIALQLDCLNDRNPKEPAALFLHALKNTLPAPTAYLKRIEGARLAKEAAEKSEREARERAENLKREKSEREETKAFYASLSTRAQSVVDERVRTSLGEVADRQKLTKRSPAWLAEMVLVLRDEDLRDTLLEMGSAATSGEVAPAEAVPMEPPVVEPVENAQGSLLAGVGFNPDLYVPILCERMELGRVDEGGIDTLRDQVAPFLEDEEWNEVKERVARRRESQ